MKAWAIALLGMLFSLSLSAGDEFRPVIDKSEIKGLVSIHANPWFAPNKNRVDALGGPDVAMRRYITGANSGPEMWAQVAKDLHEYGIENIEYEGNFEYAPISLYQPLLEGMEKSGTGMTVSYFVAAFGSAEHIKEGAIRFFNNLKPIENHPNLRKIGGRPVVQLYGFNRGMDIEAWKDAVSAIEAATGPKVWLLEMMDGTPEQLRKWMPVMDGLFMYGCWNETNQQEIFDKMVPIMHKEFPEKIFMPAAQNVYANHFHYGGVAPRLLDKYLKSWQTTIASEPDAVTMTNLFDHYEHSLHLPSYSWEDLLLRVAQYNIALWKKQKPRCTAIPELFILNTANVVVGQQMHFDIISLPTNSGTPAEAHLELVDSLGNKLHDFGKVTLRTDKMDIVRYDLDSVPFASKYTVFPRLNGRVYQPGTQIVPGIRPWVLFFARSTRNRIGLIPTNDKKHEPEEWYVNGHPGGSVIEYPADGVITVTGYARPVAGMTSNDVGTSGGHVRLLRNGRELYAFGNWDLNFTREFVIPSPKDTVDQYQLELENAVGGRFTTMPVYITTKSRPGMVRLPIVHNGKIEEIDFQAERIPYFHYRFNRDRGLLVSDLSGYSHNGYIGGKGYGGGNLQQTGYRHEHTGPVPNVVSSDPKFIDEEGGFLRFNGNGFVKFMGGTMPPYASTVEIVVRPAKLGDFGILGTANNSLQLSLTADGCIQVQRGKANEGMGGVAAAEVRNVNILSKRRIKAGEWVRIAVVYDLKDIVLYLDGVEEGRHPCGYNSDYEWLNAVVIGGNGTFPFANAIRHFLGDISELRIYSRNLSPKEFL